MSDEKPKTLAEYCEELAARPNHPAPDAVYVTAERYEELKRLQAEAAKPEPLYLRRHPALDAAAQALVGVLAGAAAAREGEDVVVAAYREHLQRAQEEVRACAGALEVGLRERRELSEQLTTARERARTAEQALEKCEARARANSNAGHDALCWARSLSPKEEAELPLPAAHLTGLIEALSDARERGRVAEHALTLAKANLQTAEAQRDELRANACLDGECLKCSYCTDAAAWNEELKQARATAERQMAYGIAAQRLFEALAYGRPLPDPEPSPHIHSIAEAIAAELKLRAEENSRLKLELAEQTHAAGIWNTTCAAHCTVIESMEAEASALKARVEVLEGALRSECDAFDYHVETGGKTQPGYTQEVWQRNRDAVRGQSPENDPALRGGA